MVTSLKRNILRLTDAIGLTRQIVLPPLDRFMRAQGTEVYTLDVGCGLGPYARYFPNRVGVDIRPSRAVDVVADAHDLRVFRSATFDCVLLTEVLEHLHTPQQALDEIHRILKADGLLVLTTRFVFPLHDVPGDYYRYTKYGLRHLLRRFEVLSLEEDTSTLGAIAVLMQRLGFQTRTLGLLPLNVVWFLLARLFQMSSILITREYGDRSGSVEERNVLASGYHVVCRKAAGNPD